MGRSRKIRNSTDTPESLVTVSKQVFEILAEELGKDAVKWVGFEKPKNRQFWLCLWDDEAEIPEEAHARLKEIGFDNYRQVDRYSHLYKDTKSQ